MLNLLVNPVQLMFIFQFRNQGMAFIPLKIDNNISDNNLEDHVMLA